MKRFIAALILLGLSGPAFAIGWNGGSGGSSGSSASTSTVLSPFQNGNGTATQNIDMGGFQMNNVSTRTYVLSANGEIATIYGSTCAYWSADSAAITANTAVSISSGSFTLPAGSDWYVDAVLNWSSSSTGGAKFAVDVPAGATIRLIGQGDGASATAVRLLERLDADVTLNTNAFGTSTSSNHQTTWRGQIILTGGGTVSFMAASGTNGETTIIQNGSYIRLTRGQ